MRQKPSYSVLLIFLLLIQTAGSIYAQKNNKISGNHHFKTGNYKLAVSAYQQIPYEDKDDKIHKRIGLCYAHLNQPTKALVYLLKASMNKGRFKNNELLIFGDILRQNSQYLAALEVYNKIIPLPKQRIKACLWAEEHLLENPFINISIVHQSINPSSFSCYKKNLLTLSFHNNESILFYTYNNNIRYTKLNYPFRMNLSVPSLNSDSTIAYFSSGISNSINYNGKNKRKISSKDGINLFIWEHKLLKTNEIPNLLPFNDKHYSCSHPYYDPSTNRLYFTSNMPGGYGGFDIYYSEKMNRHWSAPINLGPFVNSSENEIHPHVYAGKLYFSSKHAIGYGGYDIFVCDLSKLDQAPRNMGLPINSAFDDYSLQCIDDTTGFLLSKRNSTKGINHLYKVEIDKKHKCFNSAYKF